MGSAGANVRPAGDDGNFVVPTIEEWLHGPSRGGLKHPRAATAESSSDGNRLPSIPTVEERLLHGPRRSLEHPRAATAGWSRDAVSLRPGFHTWVDGSPMHFFAVFDGHGGSHVSALCRDRMHEFLAEELVREAASFLVRRELATAGGVGTSSAASSTWAEQQAEEERAWRAALERAFRRVDARAALACACGRVVVAPRPPCGCPRSPLTGYVGSTAHY